MPQGMLNDIFLGPNLLRLNQLGLRMVVGYGYSVMAMAGVLDKLVHVVRRPVLAIWLPVLLEIGLGIG